MTADWPLSPCADGEPPSQGLSGTGLEAKSGILVSESDPLSTSACCSKSPALVPAERQSPTVPDSMWEDLGPPWAASPRLRQQCVEVVPETLLPWPETPEDRVAYPSPDPEAAPLEMRSGRSGLLASVLQPSLVSETLAPWSQLLSPDDESTDAGDTQRPQSVVPETFLSWSQRSPPQQGQSAEPERTAQQRAAVLPPPAPCSQPLSAAPAASCWTIVPETLVPCSDSADESEVPASPVCSSRAAGSPADAAVRWAWPLASDPDTEGQVGSQLPPAVQHATAVPREPAAESPAHSEPAPGVEAAADARVLQPISNVFPTPAHAGTTQMSQAAGKALAAGPSVVPETVDVASDEVAEVVFDELPSSADSASNPARAAVPGLVLAVPQPCQLQPDMSAEMAWCAGVPRAPAACRAAQTALLDNPASSDRPRPLPAVGTPAADTTMHIAVHLQPSSQVMRHMEGADVIPQL